MNDPRPLLKLSRDQPHSTAPRLKVMVLTPEALTELLHGAKRPRVPKDTIVLSDQSKVGGREACWLVYSGSFPCLEPGQPAPAFYPAMDVLTT